LPAPGLRGDLQYDNAAAVLAAIEMLADAVTVPQPAIEQGLRSLSLPGRFQRIVTRSARGAIEWILDVAHNPAAANSLAGQLRAYPAAARTIAICGILGDKDIAGVARELVGQFDAWMAVGLGGVRALQPEVLAEQLRANVDTEITVAVDVAAACASATQLAEPGDRIVVFGSFLTVAAALQWLHAQPHS
jgi:dihydrofolate synthase/folylpolyglutamate synthase